MCIVQSEFECMINGHDWYSISYRRVGCADNMFYIDKLRVCKHCNCANYICEYKQINAYGKLIALYVKDNYEYYELITTKRDVYKFKRKINGPGIFERIY
jgi:hypothetical protein